MSLHAGSWLFLLAAVGVTIALGILGARRVASDDFATACGDGG